MLGRMLQYPTCTTLTSTRSSGKLTSTMVSNTPVTESLTSILPLSPYLEVIR